ncbi:MAG: murein biosynthesis integral membrane protein MurJ [Deltaproteobacteria bacterium]|nr:MAG: murein biosynthesis integral membrane protein MurJ [Deltaproteobacteria bacterium]
MRGKTLQENREIVRATGVVGSATFMSRILGLIRDMVISGYFGAGMATDAFFIAFTIPNLLRRLLGEGSLTVSFVPVYTEYLTNQPQEARRIVHVTATVVASLLLILTIVGVVLTPWIIKFQAFGWKDTSLIKLTILLTRICFPYLFFIGLVALAMGILNSHRHFAAPALAPCLLNISIITSVLLLAPRISPPVLTLAMGVFFGGLAQLLLQLPFLRAKGITFKIDFDLRHPALRRIAVMMAPMVMGIAAFQFNQVINRFLASFLPQGSISYLYYADRIFEFPLGLFAIALGVAVLPSFSRLVAEERMEEFKEGVNFSLRMILLITVPAMVGLIILRIPILNLIFQHGAFSYHSTIMSAQALLFYSFGIWAYGGINVLSRAFYAMEDAKTPVKVALIALVANFVLGVVLMHPLQHAGLALANSLSAILNVSFLTYFFHRKTRGLRWRELTSSIIKIALAIIPMSLVVLLIEQLYTWRESGGYGVKIPLLSGGVIAGITIFFLCSYFLKNKELQFLWEFIKGARAQQ